MIDVYLPGTGVMIPLENRWLTHYSPALKKPEDYLESARELFKCTAAA